MPPLPKNKEQIIKEARIITGEGYGPHTQYLQMATLFLEVLVDIRDNLEIPYMNDGDISE